MRIEWTYISVFLFKKFYIFFNLCIICHFLFFSNFYKFLTKYHALMQYFSLAFELLIRSKLSSKNLAFRKYFLYAIYYLWSKSKKQWIVELIKISSNFRDIF